MGEAVAVPLVTSLDKYGQGLYAFSSRVVAVPYGMFTNDDLFKKLGLQVPQTFSQLLDVCQKAKADGTPAVLLAGGNASTLERSQLLIVETWRCPTVYGKDKHWAAKQEAGTVTFDGTAGWHQALQEFVDMNSAGCFQPGASGTTSASAEAEFAQGQGLMLAGLSQKRARSTPPARSSPTPSTRSRAGTAANQTRTFINLERTPERQRALAGSEPGRRADVHRLRCATEAGRAVRADRGWPDAVRVPQGTDPAVHVRSLVAPVFSRQRVRRSTRPRPGGTKTSCSRSRMTGSG